MDVTYSLVRQLVAMLGTDGQGKHVAYSLAYMLRIVYVLT